MSKLDDTVDLYSKARTAVRDARRDVVAIDTEIANAREHLKALEHVKSQRIATAHAAVRRFVELANELPPLIHSEVAGIAGASAKQDEAAQ